MVAGMASKHVVLSGCSGGGKSTLLEELSHRGFPTVDEPGRRIVDEEQRGNGAALPWVDLAKFAERALRLAAEDRERMSGETGWVFFDRGLVDAAVALAFAGGDDVTDRLAPFDPYHRLVFMTPPWPEIYQTDDARRHDLGEAVAEYDRLITAYAALGYEAVVLPKFSVAERADFLLAALR
ncbi:Predicted ATPase [Fulvimarina manganoxydans]|uniref:Predicted ATPase n=2 Tax=Fulvimarina manganoxydans TaxID=937218 RepID=A0A1W2BSD5_9HYPH|nr:Predicted ATPase [Fulvimarina manganoxydans]